MEAIKKTRVKRNGNEITLVLPESFTAKEVDVLIWPSNEVDGSLESLSAELLKWPEMTDEELSSLNEKRKHLNTWK